MAITDPTFVRSRAPTDHAPSPAAPRGHSGASTWYLVIGAAVLLIVLYTMTTGLMRPVPEGLGTGPMAPGLTAPEAPASGPPAN